MRDQIRARVIRSLAGVEEIRGPWISWQNHPNSDIDFYLNTLRSRLEIQRPHIIVVYREGRPDAMLVGRVERRQVDLKLGYLSPLKPKALLLNFLYAGLLGEASSENCSVMVREIQSALRRKEADAAVLNCVRTDSPIYNLARRTTGILSRGHLPRLQRHWSMHLPTSIGEIYGGLSRQHRWQIKSKIKKFMAQYPDEISIRCFHKVTELEAMIRDIEEVAKKTYQRGLGVGFIDSPELRRRLDLEVQKGWLRTYLLYVGGKPCAFWTGSLYRGTFHSASLGYDSSYADFSPGTFLFMRMLEEFCRSGVKEVDFGLGEARYKERFGSREWKESTVYFFALSARGIWLKILQTTTMLIERVLREVLERSGLLPQLRRVWRDRLRQSQRDKG